MIYSLYPSNLGQEFGMVVKLCLGAPAVSKCLCLIAGSTYLFPANVHPKRLPVKCFESLPPTRGRHGLF